MWKHGKKNLGDPAWLSPTVRACSHHFCNPFQALKCHRDRIQVRARDQCQWQRRKSNSICMIKYCFGMCDFYLKVWPDYLLNGKEDRNGKRGRWISTACLQRPWRRACSVGNTFRMLSPVIAPLKGYSGKTWAHSDPCPLCEVKEPCRDWFKCGCM